MGRWYWAFIALVVLLTIGSIYAEYSNRVPCSWYSHSRVSSVPARCLSTFSR
jgi:hypothetical protein